MDAECQTIEFDYMFQTSRYQAQNNDIFDTDDKVRFYTGLLSKEVLMHVFKHVAWHVTPGGHTLHWRQTQTLNRF